MMKQICLLIISIFFSVSLYGQSIFFDYPPKYWENFNLETNLKNANEGNLDAQLIQAMYYVDRNVNINKFKYWIEKASTSGNPSAMWVMAKCYMMGDYGFSQNIQKALELLRKSASLNHTSSIEILVDIYRIGMYNITKDEHTTYYWALKGANLGSAYCQYVCGNMLTAGIGVPKDLKLGCEWLEKSSDQNCIDAQTLLIMHYENIIWDDRMQQKEQNGIIEEKLLNVGRKFLNNPQIINETDNILCAKGTLGWFYCAQHNYKEGIPLMRESLKTNEGKELMEYNWKILNDYAHAMGTTIQQLEKQ